MYELFIFPITFLLIYSYYRIFVIRKNMDYKTDKKRLEITYLVNNYKLNFKKIDYNEVIRTIALVNSFIISLILTISGFVSMFWLQMIVMGLLLIPSIYFTYNIIGKYYEEKMKTKKKVK